MSTVQVPSLLCLASMEMLPVRSIRKGSDVVVSPKLWMFPSERSGTRGVLTNSFYLQ